MLFSPIPSQPPPRHRQPSLNVVQASATCRVIGHRELSRLMDEFNVTSHCIVESTAGRSRLRPPCRPTHLDTSQRPEKKGTCEAFTFTFTSTSIPR
jgi:hypothetical protein